MPKSRIVIGYKMVKIDLKSALIDENTFLSSCSKYQELWPVQYKIGELIYPNVPKTKLMAFKSLEDVRNFRNLYWTPKRIFKCYMLNPKISGPSSTISNVDIVWKKYQQKKEYRYLCVCAPKNTLWCDAIQLIEEIKA